MVLKGDSLDDKGNAALVRKIRERIKCSAPISNEMSRKKFQ
jgi:hypothetical protein